MSMLSGNQKKYNKKNRKPKRMIDRSVAESVPNVLFGIGGNPPPKTSPPAPPGSGIGGRKRLRKGKVAAAVGNRRKSVLCTIQSNQQRSLNKLYTNAVKFKYVKRKEKKDRGKA